MQSAEYPFLCNLEYFFQTDVRLYFVMPFIKGGDLFKLIRAKRRL